MNNFRSHSRGGRSSFSRRRFSHGNNQSRGGRRSYNRPRGPMLNPMMFVRKAQEIAEAEHETQHQFTDFDLDPQLHKNIASRGFTTPTPIQDQAIKPLLESRDLVGIANTGTGKTAAFLIPLINKITKHSQEKVLIVAPTRELAIQIRDELSLFANGLNIRSTLCIGGASMNRQIDSLHRNPNFVIGTPGRLKDLNQRNHLKLEQYANVVLDEVDRMLDMGFIRDIKEIINQLPSQRQSLFFSATLPEKTRLLMHQFLTNPVNISVSTGPTAQNVDQDIIKTDGKDKTEILHQLLISKGFEKVLVFGRTKWGINKLEKALIDRGHRVSSIHGNKSQSQRQKALQDLRNNHVRILLATDVASRGLDIEDITHVINYDVPESYDDYVHRIGRTGRAGKKGIALTFVD